MVAGGPGGVPARCHPQVHHGSCSSSRGKGGREGTIEARRQEMEGGGYGGGGVPPVIGWSREGGGGSHDKRQPNNEVIICNSKSETKLCYDLAFNTRACPESSLPPPAGVFGLKDHSECVQGR